MNDEQQIAVLVERLSQLESVVGLLRRENGVLRSDQEALRAENKALRAENAALRAESETLKADIVLLQVENEALKAEIQQFQAQQGEGGGPPEDPPPFVKPNKRAKTRKARRKRAAKHNRARRRETPTRIQTYQLEACPTCAGRLSKGTLHTSRQVIDIPAPQPAEVVDHRVMKGWCHRCRRWHWPSVEWDGIVVGNSRFGVRLMGLVGYLRAQLRVPLATIQQYLAAVHRVEMSVGAVNGLCHRLANRLQPVLDGMLATARASPVVHMDETGWREDGMNGYIWCLVTDSPKPVRYFLFDHSRAGRVAAEFLGHFRGTLVTDFYSAYSKYDGVHQRCWVHLLRDLHELRQEHPDHEEILDWARGVDALYRLATEQLAAQPTQAERDALAEQLWRQAEQFGLMYADCGPHPCRALAKRLLRHIDELFQFVKQPDVPADNNLAERALRPLVVQRKISGGSRTPRGSKTRMKLASLFATWQARLENPLHACWIHLGYSPSIAVA